MAESLFKIHHLSDVHIGISHYHASVNLTLPNSTGKWRNADAYLAHLESLEQSAFPDLVIVSGDLTSCASQDEMNAAEDFLAKLADMESWQTRRLPPQAPRILIIPGNHDLDWSKDKAEEKHERYCRMSEALRNSGVLSSKYIRSRQNPWWDFGDEANIFVYLLNSTPHGGVKDPALQSIYDLIREKAGNIGVSPDALETFRQQVRKDPGFVLNEEIAALKKEALRVPAGRIKLAVVHHNPNHVPSDDQQIFDTIVNSGALKAALLQSGFHLVLHGHRHMFHTSVESHPASPFSANRCHFVGADSLGCQDDAPFLEYVFSRKNHSGATPCSVTVAVKEYHYSHPNGFALGDERCKLTLSKAASYELGEFAENATSARDMTPESKAAFIAAWPVMKKIHAELTPKSNVYEWVDQFHNQLDTYKRIWATALFGPQDIADSQYQKYLRQQYARRLDLTRRIPEKTLYYSPDVHRAIIRARWQPAQELWGGYRLAAQSRSSPTGLEVARIAIVDESVDLVALESLFFDHALCAIPLFVIERKHLDDASVVNCAIGFDAAENPIKAYAASRLTGEVTEQKIEDRYELLNTFEQLLSHRKLINANEFVGHQRMYKERAGALAAQYATARKPSTLILRVLRENLPLPGKCGIDLCCGTGNYTQPFVGSFTELFALDLSAEMLAEAKKRVDGVKWLRTDAKDTTLPDNSCDAAWMISALHYFQGDEQPMLLAEVYRLLKPGGVFIADTEFLEQHPSLWIADYFPSLKKRFENCLFSKDQYREWLKSAGFNDVDFKTYDYSADEKDGFLRIGQHDPAVYLNSNVRLGIPAFQVMDPVERRQGFERLRDEIGTGEVMRVRDRYIKSATLPGDLGFILARK